MPPAPTDHTSKQFGQWTAIRLVDNPRKQGAVWLCRCDCGTEKAVSATALVTGKSKSCGCTSQARRTANVTKHGQSGAGNGGRPTGAYSSWHAMLQRCENKKSLHYADYGGRGITVCDRWQVFVDFFEDMGERPHGLTLDRINVDLGYSKENCRWATRKQQSNNQRPKIKNSDVFGLLAAARAVVAANDNDLRSAVERLGVEVTSLTARAA